MVAEGAGVAEVGMVALGLESGGEGVGVWLHTGPGVLVLEGGEGLVEGRWGLLEGGTGDVHSEEHVLALILGILGVLLSHGFQSSVFVVWVSLGWRLVVEI